jgi:hypothetical protein
MKGQRHEKKVGYDGINDGRDKKTPSVQGVFSYAIWV